MNKVLSSIFLLILSFNLSFAQLSFKKGYLIDQDWKEVSCFIKEGVWHSSPSSFQYKLSEDSEVKNADISKVREFGIGNYLKYKRFKVDIDKSSNNVNKMSLVNNPNFVQETLFLKVLIEGNASLYSYQESDFIRFFFKKEDTKIQQLIYKKYKQGNSQVRVNEQYKSQLEKNLSCGNTMNQYNIDLEYTPI